MQLRCIEVIRFFMRILHVYKTYYTESFGGVEQFIRQLGMGHARMGHKVSVLTLANIDAPNEMTQDGVRVLRYPLTAEVASNGFSLTAMRDFRMLAQKADVLHYHYPWPSGDLLHQLAPRNIPTVLTYHSDIIRQKLLKYAYWPLMQRFLHQMDAIVATSPNYVQSSPVLQNYRNKTSVVPIGLDEATYPKPSEEKLSALREQLGEGFFLFLGMIRYYKGLHTLVEAAARTGLPVVIAGEGPQEAELRVQAEKLGAPVMFLGRVDEATKMALLHLCKAFVFPSHQRSEAFGISLLEAAMMGKPMISCEIGTGSSYININGQTGYVVAPEDATAFAAAMQSLQADAEKARWMGEAAQTRYHAIFTAQKMAEDYLTLYQQLQESRAQRSA